MPNQNKNTDIDVGLSVLCVLAEYGQTLTNKQIADVCGCNDSYIGEISKRALNKLKNNSQSTQLLEHYNDGR